MSTQDKYESRIRKAAQLENLEHGLRNGGKCLICQCWRNPCAKCKAVAGNGHGDSRGQVTNGKSPKYQRAADQLP